MKINNQLSSSTLATEALFYFIYTEKYLPGMKLPTENELSEKLELSRSSVRTAIKNLINDGLLIKIFNKGTFIRHTKLSISLFEGDSFMQSLRLNDSIFRTDLLKFQSKIANPSIKNSLKLKENQIFHIYRRRLYNFDPIYIESILLNKELCPDLSDHYSSKRSLSFTLKNIYHYEPYDGSVNFSIGFANHYEAELLKIKPNSALMILKGIKYITNDQPLLIYKQLYIADKFKFTSYRY